MTNRYVSFRRNSVPSQKYLAGLERIRMLCLFLSFIFLVIALIGEYVGYTPPFTIILLILNAIVYLDHDMKIKVIKLFQADRSTSDVVP